MITLNCLYKTIGKQVVAMHQCVRRFPIVVAFTIAITLYVLSLIWGHDEWFTERGNICCMYYLSVGSVLSLSLALWSEEVKRRLTAVATQVAAHALLAADALYLYHLPADGFGMEIFLAHAACIGALGLSVFLLPFFRAKSDVPALNFSLQLVGNAAVSLMVGIVMWGGTALLFLSFESLFGFDISHNCFHTISLLCIQLLGTLLFVGRIPQGAYKHNTTVYASAFTIKLIRYLFLPLMGGYLAVLYAYMGKILLSWQLPDGWVSWLVITLMAGCIAIEFALYPRLESDRQTRSFEHQVARWLPILILPLLLLMTVGIARRISDYGLTLNRLYVLTLNGWFYLVCIGLFLGRARRIHWIPVSLSVLLLLTSALPINYASIIHRYLYNKVYEQVKTTYHGSLPMTEEQYFDWLLSLGRNEALLVNSRLRQLDDAFQDKSIGQLVATTNFWGANAYIEEKGEPKTLTLTDPDTGKKETVGSKHHYIYICWQGSMSFSLPQTADSLRIFQNAGFRQKLTCPQTDTLRIALPLAANAAPDSLCVSLADLKKWDKMKQTSPKELRCTQPDTRFILTGCDLSLYPDQISGDLSGYYYTDKKASIP